METNIFLIRHSKKNYDVVRFTELEGGFNHDLIPLSIEGEELAIKLSKSDVLKDIDYIYSSTTVRTINTIKYYAEINNMKIYLTDDIIERKFGDLSILKAGEKLSDLQRKDRDFKCPGGESYNEVEKRMVARVNKVLKSYSGKNIIFSTHNTAMKVLISHYDKNFENNSHENKISNPGIYKMTFEDNIFIKYESLEI